jgi:hypothetical protein
MGRTRAARNPLEPLTTTVLVVTVATFALLAIVGVATVFGSGSILGWGDPEVCIDVPNGTIRTSGVGAEPQGLPANSRAYASTITVCAQEPSTALRIGATLLYLPWVLLFFGFLLLVHRLLRAAAGDGIYSLGTARRLRFLGWFLLAGGLLAATVEALARGYVLSAQFSYLDWLSGANQWSVSFPLLLSAIGLITFARVMRIGVDMREDLEGTV